MTAPRVRTAAGPHVSVLTVDNPPHNFVSTALLRELADAFAAADADPEVRAIVLQSDGKNFCAGADFSGPREAVPEGMTLLPMYEQGLRLYATRKPIVAAVQGSAVGAGLGLALLADFRIATEETRFAANFVKLALHPGFGITLALPRLIGTQKAALMLLTGRRVKGEQALAWGLADELVAAERLREVALNLAAEIAEGGPLAVISTRSTLRGDLVQAIRKQVVLEFKEQQALQNTEDFAEGVRSVAERRPGNFKGR